MPPLVAASATGERCGIVGGRSLGVLARARGLPSGRSRALLVSRSGAIDTPDKIQHPKKRAFLEAYARCGIIATACRYAGINRWSYYHWTEVDEAFSAACKRAYAEACDYVEEVALQRATIGREVVKEIYENGELVRREVTTQVSDTMLAMMLNGAKPEKYKIRADVAHTHAGVVKAVDKEFWEAL